MVIKRDFYLKQIISKQENGRIKIITGIKGCGKSFLLFNLFKDYLLSQGVKQNQIISIALDEIENAEYRNPFKLNEYIKEKTKNQNRKFYILIDEIQCSLAVNNPFIDGDEKSITFVDVLLGLMKKSNLDIYITSSNSKMLATELPTQFRDRGDEIHVNALAFSEICDLFANKNLALKHYMVYGGMPYIYKLKTDEEKSQYLKKLFQETYIKDVLEKNGVHNEQEILELLLDFISTDIGSSTNPSKLANRFLSEKQISITSNTISKYLGLFEEAYVIYRVRRYNVKQAKYFSTPFKFYFADLGLRNARLNFRQGEENQIMENIIYNELVRRGYNIDIGIVEYDHKTKEQRKKVQLEVDFLINKGNQKYYIQSAFDLKGTEKKEQEIASLQKINDSFKKIVIVRENTIPMRDEQGILYIGLADFLLNETIIDM